MAAWSQVVAFLIGPLGTAAVLSMVVLLCVWIGALRVAVALSTFAIAWVLFWSLPIASLALRARIESGSRHQATSELPHCETMVVLGGTVQPPNRMGGDVNLFAGADRVWYAARLYKAGKAPLVLLSGGSDPDESAFSEAEAMQIFLRDLGVPDSAMLLEKRSRNTHQNAEYSAAILKARGIHHILLVTSALHMTRARVEFQRQGLEVTPAPTDFEATSVPPAPWRYLPDAASLEGSGRAFKELLGQWVLCRGPCGSASDSVPE